MSAPDAPSAAAPAPPPAPALHVTIAAPPLTEAQRLAAEKDQKEKALQEKLDKRAAIVVTVLRKFITSFYAGRQQMLAEARAAEAAKAAKKGKKGKKGKKKDAAAKEEKGKKDDKGGKGKKPTKTPVQEAWSTFMADMDDRISKQKRVNLEDVFRGVAKLEPREATALAALLATTTTKILPLDGMNINQMNLREALMAASAAQQLPRDRAAPDSGHTPGLDQIQERGGSAQQALGAGFRAQDLLRVGYPPHDVVAAAQTELDELRLGGVSVAGCLTSPGAQELAARLREGARGYSELREAGYTLHELMSAGLNNPWDLARAGYPMGDLYAVGFTPADLRAAGFGAPESQPTGFLGQTISTLMTDTDARSLPAWQEGTQTFEWSSLLARGTAGGGAHATHASTAAAGAAGSGAKGLRASHASVAVGLRASTMHSPSVATVAAAM